MTDFIKVKPLRTFDNGSGLKTADSEPFKAERGEANALKALGLVSFEDDVPSEQETAATDDAPQDGSVVTSTTEPDNAPVIEPVVDTVADPVVVEPVSEPITEAENAPKTAKRVKKDKPDADNEGA
jgi:hypothetical protein